MGNTPTTVSNDTEHDFQFEVWAAGKRADTGQIIDAQPGRSYVVLLGKSFNTVILRIESAYGAFPRGSFISVSEKENLLMMTSRDSLGEDKWHSLPDESNAGIGPALRVLDMTTKLGVGLVNRAVTGALTASGSSSLVAFAGGQLAGGLAEMGLGAMRGSRGPSVGSQVASAMKDREKECACLHIKTCLISLCRAIRHEYLPLKKAAPENREELKRRLQTYLSTFGSGFSGGFGLMPYLEYVQDGDTLVLYLSAVSLHLVLLQELIAVTKGSPEEVATERSLRAYLNLYRDNALTMWETVVEEHCAEIVAKLRVAWWRPMKYARLENNGLVIMRVRGLGKKSVQRRIDDVTEAYTKEQKRLLKHFYKDPEKIFDNWARIASNEVDVDLDIEQLNDIVFQHGQRSG